MSTRIPLPDLAPFFQGGQILRENRKKTKRYISMSDCVKHKASNTRRPLLTFVSAPLVSWTLAASPALLPVVGIMSAAVEEEEEEVSSLLPRPSLSSSSLSNTLNVFHACVRMLHPGDIERYQYMKLSHRHVHHFLTQFGGHTSIVFAQFRPGTNERTDRRHLFAVAAAARHHHPLLYTVLGSTWASNNSVYSSGK